MKHLIIILFLSLTTHLFAQQNTDEYKDYKPCTECLTQPSNPNEISMDKWKKSGLGNYGIAPQANKAKTYLSGKVKGIFGVVVGIVVVAVTYSIYSKVNTAANGIH